MFLNQDKQGSPAYKVLVTGTFVSGSGDEFSITVPSPVVYKKAWEANTDDWNFEFRNTNGRIELYAWFVNCEMAYPYMDERAFVANPDTSLKGPGDEETGKNFVGLLSRLEDGGTFEIRKQSVQIKREP